MARTDDLDLQAIGERIARWRGMRRMPQSALAQKSGVSRAYIARLEVGSAASPRISDLASIARALDIQLENLIGDRPPPSAVTPEDNAELQSYLRQPSSVPTGG